MTTIDPKNIALDSLGQGAPARTASKALGQEQFLELMVTQLRNQDPLKPLQNGEFLGQLAQFGTVNGIQELQTSFAQLSSALQSSQALMASSLVGRAVLAPAGGAIHTPGIDFGGVVELKNGAEDVAVGIYDASGQLVRRLALGPQAAGLARFSWDGRGDNGAAAPAGRYEVRAVARVGGENVSAATLLSARVDSVTLGGAQGLTLNLAGIGAVPLSEVRQIG
jgi:flagellar basal-body rod modification protein FlgD